MERLSIPTLVVGQQIRNVDRERLSAGCVLVGNQEAGGQVVGVIRTPAEGVGRDSPRLGLRID
jgi:hypothetical protein